MLKGGCLGSGDWLWTLQLGTIFAGSFAKHRHFTSAQGLFCSGLLWSFCQAATGFFFICICIDMIRGLGRQELRELCRSFQWSSWSTSNTCRFLGNFCFQKFIFLLQTQFPLRTLFPPWDVEHQQFSPFQDSQQFFLDWLPYFLRTKSFFSWSERDWEVYWGHFCWLNEGRVTFFELALSFLYFDFFSGFSTLQYMFCMLMFRHQQWIYYNS